MSDDLIYSSSVFDKLLREITRHTVDVCDPKVGAGYLVITVICIPSRKNSTLIFKRIRKIHVKLDLIKSHQIKQIYGLQVFYITDR